MDEEGKKILRENLKFSRDNHRILKGLQRNMRWSRGLRVVYWLVIIGGALGAYYYIQPFVDSLREGFGSIQTGAGGVTDGVETGLGFLKNIFVE